MPDLLSIVTKVLKAEWKEYLTNKHDYIAYHSYHLPSTLKTPSLVLRSFDKSSPTNTSILLMRKLRLRGINLLEQGRWQSWSPTPDLTPKPKTCSPDPYSIPVFQSITGRCQEEGSDRCYQAHPSQGHIHTLYNDHCNHCRVIQLLEEKVFCLLTSRSSSIHTE